MGQTAALRIAGDLKYPRSELFRTPPDVFVASVLFFVPDFFITSVAFFVPVFRNFTILLILPFPQAAFPDARPGLFFNSVQKLPHARIL